MPSILPPPAQTRLLTIVAHVDHGKTTLADNLVESNGIISERHAGTVRYLDSLPDEQRRGITMRSSAIGLRHLWNVPPNFARQRQQQQSGGGGGGGDAGAVAAKGGGGKSQLQLQQQQQQQQVVVHLIDSPGHVDFSAEVTTSLLSCDGALLLVDAVEGMCARTHNILREAYAAQLVPVLVINKVDRLCTDLGLGMNEAYVRLRGLVESLNAACAAMVAAEAATETNCHRSSDDEEDRSDHNNDEDDHDHDEEGAAHDDDHDHDDVWNFDPVRGNVVFASALHGWGFTVPALARSLYKSKTLPIKPLLLRQYLFGDFRYRPKDGKVMKWNSSSVDDDDTPTMFAEFGLRPLWEAYGGGEEAEMAVGGGGYTAGGIAIDGSGGSGGNGSGNDSSKTSGKKITSETPGMDRLLTALQIGSTSTSTPPSSSSSSEGGDHPSSAVLVPTTPAEMQRILSRTTGSTCTTSAPILRALLRRYRPLSHAVLDAACEFCPDPARASRAVRKRVLAVRDFPPPPREGGESSAAALLVVDDENDDTTTDDERLLQRAQRAVRQCDPSSDVPTVAHVCKFVVTDRSYVTDPGLPSDLGLGGTTDGTTHGRSEENGHDGRRANNNDDGGGKPPAMIMGLTRVLSGTLHSGTVDYYALGPRYRPRPEEMNAVRRRRRTLRLYLLMGSSFVKVDSVPAGHICAVYDLEDLQLKTATLTDGDVRGMMPIRGFHHGLKPLVKVNVEPVSACDTAALERGLVKLTLADASVEVTATSRGERILACLGEIHLEQSIRDLERIYCGKEVALRVSEPIVEFGESTAWFDNEVSSEHDQFFDDGTPPLRQVTIPPYCYEEGLVQANRGRCRALLSSRPAAISVRVVPLSRRVYDSLKVGAVVDGAEEDLCIVGKVLRCGSGSNEGSSISAANVLASMVAAGCMLDGNGNAMVETAGMRSGQCIKSVPSDEGEVYVPPPTLPRSSNGVQLKSGEAGAGDGDGDGDGAPCGRDEYEMIRRRIRLGGIGAECGPPQSDTEDRSEDAVSADCCAADIWRSEMRGSALAGFELAMRSGPFCEESVRGVMVVIEAVEIALNPKSANDAAASDNNRKKFRPVKPFGGGMVVAALRTGIRCALLTRPCQLVEGHLRLTLHSSLAGLGSLYAVLSKRRGKVLSDTMVDGTDLIRITATLPQAESFHLAPELLKESSGEVTAPELVFSHWEVLEEDPFWIPTSLEEREDYGEILMSGDSSTGLRNNAIKYIRMVRERKGLLVDSKKIVVAAEKQRTLAKKK